jgi:hypothetical protein
MNILSPDSYCARCLKEFSLYDDDDNVCFTPAEEKRKKQIEFCRSLISRIGCDTWEDLLLRLTPEDRMDLYLAGLNTHTVLKREFAGMLNDERRALRERVRLLAASLPRCSVRLALNRL